MKTLTPRPYQIDGKEFIKPRRFTLLADDVGLGKSLQIILAAKELQVGSLLVLCPATLQANWIAEFKKFWPEVEPLRVTSKLKIFPAFAVASYDYAKRAKARFTREYDLLVLDESHFLKSHKSQRTKAILGKGGIASKAKRTVFATATPVEKSIADAWPMLYSQGIVKETYNQFTYRYCVIERTPFADVIKGTQPGRIPEIKEMLRPVMLRRLKSEVAKDLPTLNFYPLAVDGSPVDLAADMPELNKKLTEALQVQAVLTGVGKNVEELTYQDLQKFGALFQQLNHYNALAKVNDTVKLAVDRLESDPENKVVIFTNFTKPLEQIKAGLAKAGYIGAHISGSTKKADIGTTVDLFQTDPLHRYLVCNIASAGAGLTLTAADYEIFNDLSLSATANKQSLGRCHRIGTVADVTAVSVTLADNKIDKRIFDLIEQKMKDSEMILD